MSKASAPEVIVPPPLQDPGVTNWRQVRLYLVLVALVSLGTGAVIGRFADEGPQPATLPPPDAWSAWCVPPANAPTLIADHPAEIWYVYVTGAVMHPQVVTVTAGSLVADALAAAGGPAPAADLEAINLAAPLQNYQHIHVPTRPLTPTPAPVPPAAEVPTPAPGTGTPTTLININTADAATLATLPKIGPTTAQRIVEYRQANGPFQTIADIQKVPGIGPTIFKAIAPYITVGP